MKNDDTALSIAVAIVALVLFIPICAFDGWIFHNLWSWFIEPVVGWKSPGIVQFAGIFAFLAVGKVWMATVQKMDAIEPIRFLTITIVANLAQFTLFVLAWIFHLLTA